MAKLTHNDLKNMLPEKRRAYEKRIKKVRRNRKILASLVCVTVILIAVIVLSLTVFFSVDTIIVKGESIYDNQQIIEESGIKKEDNLFLASISKASDEIPKKLPYILSAQVKRQLPSTIIIEIKKAQADYAFESASGFAVADSTGKTLEFVNEDNLPKSAALIKTSGILSAKIGEKFTSDNEDDMALLKEVFNAINESGIKDITQINICERANIYLTYQNRFKLNIGTSNELIYKLKSAIEIIKKEDEINTSASGEIFLNNPGNAYVTPNKE